MKRALSQDARGTLASVGSSLAFGGIYLLTPLLSPASAETLWAARTVVAVGIVALALIAMRQWDHAASIWRRIKRKPVMIVGVLLSGALLAAQLWVFAWAPLNGHGLGVALGYFLLPLVLVVVGKFLYKDKLVWWQWTAAGIAAAGVAFEIVRAGGISFETLIVAGLYPCYFVLRRWLGTGHLGGMFWDFLVLAPVAIVVLVLELMHGTALTENPGLFISVPVYSVVSAVALMLYIAASRLLTLSVFGLLSYLEPALLMIAALLIGERIVGDETVIYIAVWIAVFFVLGGGIGRMVKARTGRVGS